MSPVDGYFERLQEVILTLDSPEWGKYKDFLGNSDRVPALLNELYQPTTAASIEDDLWGRLCNQGATLQCSFAALPHILISQAAKQTPSWSMLALFAAIEVSRINSNVEVLPNLATAYYGALNAAPVFLGRFIPFAQDPLLCRAILAAMAISAGNATIAAVLLDLSAELAEKFLNTWRFE